MEAHHQRAEQLPHQACHASGPRQPASHMRRTHRQRCSDASSSRAVETAEEGRSGQVWNVEPEAAGRGEGRRSRQRFDGERAPRWCGSVP